MNYRNFICGALLLFGCVGSKANVTITSSDSASVYCAGDSVTLSAVDDNPPGKPLQSECCKAGGGNGTWSESANYAWTGASGSGATAKLDTSQPGSVTVTVAINYTWTCSEGGVKTSVSSGSTVFKIIKVESILPDMGQEIDDGDDDSETKVFLVPVAASGVVTVTATLNPPLGENEVPDGMTLQGGGGSKKLTRTVDRTVPSKIVFAFSSYRTLSPLRTTVYVYQARLGLYATAGSLDDLTGHSWWGLNIDPFALELVDRDLRRNLALGGFFSRDREMNGPGALRWGWADASNNRSATGSRNFQIPFDSLVAALTFVEGLRANTPDYHLKTYNCTDVAVEVGEHAGVNTIGTAGFTTPTALSNWLNAHPN